MKVGISPESLTSPLSHFIPYLQEILSDTHSRAQAEAIAAWVGTDAGRFQALLDVLFGDDPLLVQRAAWPLRVVGDARPEMLAPHWPTLIDYLGAPVHVAVRRNVLALAAERREPWPEALLGYLVDHCFRLLASPPEPPAVKVHAMTILLHACRQEPGLKPELQATIEAQMPMGSRGFVNRGRKVLRALARISEAGSPGADVG
ncbi:MAG: hypothetical protein D6722_05330 [Bacteroidetes bacterium]|nr:MAG: hypothetical protein D6722_05330 [Bacteroidota bacterium]